MKPMKTLRNMLYAIPLLALGCNNDNPGIYDFYDVKALHGAHVNIESTKGNEPLVMKVTRDSVGYDRVMTIYFYGTSSTVHSRAISPFYNICPARLEEIADSLLKEVKK